jgi:hypothetical protein
VGTTTAPPPTTILVLGGTQFMVPAHDAHLLGCKCMS